jgi:nucleoside-diphosphate-sugar epimerase
MYKISILGCGWLGFPLAKSLLQNGYKICGSTTSVEKISKLKNAGITPFIIRLSENEIEGEINSFLKNSEVLLIDIPPKLRGDSSENFVEKIQNLVPYIEKSSVKKVIFVSSTSVYSDDNSIITEETKPQSDTESGKQLLEVEQILQNNTNFQTVILRFGGLIGDDRHPIKFLAGRTNIENPDGAINLIHQIDCIGIIEEILRQMQNDKLKRNEIFNAVAPFHPTRKDYYTTKAKEQNLSLPQFNESKTSIGKIILSEKVALILNYNFINKLL